MIARPLTACGYSSAAKLPKPLLDGLGAPPPSADSYPRTAARKPPSTKRRQLGTCYVRVSQMARITLFLSRLPMCRAPCGWAVPRRRARRRVCTANSTFDKVRYLQSRYLPGIEFFISSTIPAPWEANLTFSTVLGTWAHDSSVVRRPGCRWPRLDSSVCNLVLDHKIAMPRHGDAFHAVPHFLSALYLPT